MKRKSLILLLQIAALVCMLLNQWQLAFICEVFVYFVCDWIIDDLEKANK